LLDEIFAPLRRSSPDDHLLDATSCGDGFHLKRRLPARPDDPENFTIRWRKVLGRNTRGSTSPQAAQESHVDDRLNAAFPAMIKRNRVGLCGIGPEANEIHVLMPCGHHVELFFAAFEPPPRHTAHFAGRAIAEHFVEQSHSLRHVDELMGLWFTDD